MSFNIISTMSVIFIFGFSICSKNKFTAEIGYIYSKNIVLSEGSWLLDLVPLLDVIMMLRFGQSSINLLRSILNSSFMLLMISSALSKHRRKRLVYWPLCFCFFISYSTLLLKKSMMKVIKLSYEHVLCVNSTSCF